MNRQQIALMILAVGLALIVGASLAILFLGNRSAETEIAAEETSTATVEPTPNVELTATPANDLPALPTLTPDTPDTELPTVVEPTVTPPPTFTPPSTLTPAPTVTPFTPPTTLTPVSTFTPITAPTSELPTPTPTVFEPPTPTATEPPTATPTPSLPELDPDLLAELGIAGAVSPFERLVPFCLQNAFSEVANFSQLLDAPGEVFLLGNPSSTQLLNSTLFPIDRACVLPLLLLDSELDPNSPIRLTISDGIGNLIVERELLVSETLLLSVENGSNGRYFDFGMSGTLNPGFYRATIAWQTGSAQLNLEVRSAPQGSMAIVPRFAPPETTRQVLFADLPPNVAVQAHLYYEENSLSTISCSGFEEPNEFERCSFYIGSFPAQTTNADGVLEFEFDLAPDSPPGRYILHYTIEGDPSTFAGGEKFEIRAPAALRRLLPDQ